MCPLPPIVGEGGFLISNCTVKSMENIILLAAKFAKEAHKGQVRKYTGRDYITHPARVAGLAAIHPLATVDMVVAAYLHDVLEDTDADISIFTPGAQKLVREMTNPSKGSKAPRAVRKKQDRDHLAEISDQGKVLKLLDRGDNLREMDQADPKFLKLYLDESELLVEAIGDVDPELKQELLDLIKNMRE
jgi:(p)ppGpp synthase/HD superfamily hydrolase